MPTRTEVSFQSEGRTLRGWLECVGGKPMPLVVMAHGMGGVKEWLADASAAISDAGFACLVYDNPHFGTSDGEPRQHVDPTAQVRAYRDAISFGQTLAEVDPARVALWGTSLTGGMALVAGAVDRRVRAVVVQVPVVDPWATLRRMLPEAAVTGALESMEADRMARFAGDAYKTTPLVGGQGQALQSDPRGLEHLNKLAAGSPTFRNEITLASYDLLLELAPHAFIERISPRALHMTVTTHDTLCPTDLALAAFERAREPKQLNLLPGDHYSCYEEQFEAAISSQIAFLRTHL